MEDELSAEPRRTIHCFAGDTFIAEPVYDSAGNKIGGGIGVATTRLLLGFDRLFGDRWLVGGRLGFAFGGGPAAPGGSGFMPLHVEGRVAAYFGSSPSPAPPFALTPRSRAGSRR
jgi:hypothetical protein